MALAGANGTVCGHILTHRYAKVYYFPGYGIEDLKQEILIAIYKIVSFF